MNALNEVKIILDKYKFEPINLPENYKNIYQLIRDNQLIGDKYNFYDDDKLFNNYKKNIPKRWYGFSINGAIIPEWINIITNVLDLLISIDENLEIHQIKMKYGGIRFYVESLVIIDINEIVTLLESKLFDKALIY